MNVELTRAEIWALIKALPPASELDTVKHDRYLKSAWLKLVDQVTDNA